MNFVFTSTLTSRWLSDFWSILSVSIGQVYAADAANGLRAT